MHTHTTMDHTHVKQMKNVYKVGSFRYAYTRTLVKKVYLINYTHHYEFVPKYATHVVFQKLEKVHVAHSIVHYSTGGSYIITWFTC